MLSWIAPKQGDLHKSLTFPNFSRRNNMIVFTQRGLGCRAAK